MSGQGHQAVASGRWHVSQIQQNRGSNLVKKQGTHPLGSWAQAFSVARPRANSMTENQLRSASTNGSEPMRKLTKTCSGRLFKIQGTINHDFSPVARMDLPVSEAAVKEHLRLPRDDTKQWLISRRRAGSRASPSRHLLRNVRQKKNQRLEMEPMAGGVSRGCGRESRSALGPKLKKQPVTDQRQTLRPPPGSQICSSNVWNQHGQPRPNDNPV